MLKFIVLFICLRPLSSSVDTEDDEGLNDDILSALESEWEYDQSSRDIDERAISDIFKCRKRNDPCGGIISCCSGSICYWENGYSLIKNGVCVECVQKNLTCQSNGQCCGSLACHKQKALYIDGICSEKKGQGEKCHDKGQCLSNKCILNAWQNLMFLDGYCQ